MNRISETPQGQGASSCKHDPHQRNLGIPGLSPMSAPKTSTEIQTPKRKHQKRWKIDILDIRNIGEIHPKKNPCHFLNTVTCLEIAQPPRIRRTSSPVRNGHGPSAGPSEVEFWKSTGCFWWAFYVKMSRCQATLQGASLPNCHHHPENTRKWCQASHPST